MSELEIPERLAVAIRAAWPNEEVLAPHARNYGLLRRFFTRERIFVKRALPSEPTLAFWRIVGDEDLTDFLFDGLLPALNGEGSSKRSLKGYPLGYKPLRVALNFEQHVQWEGFADAVLNEISSVPAAASAYRLLGMEGEAKGLLGAHRIAKAATVQDDALVDSLTEAYCLGLGSTQVFDSDAAFRQRMTAIGEFIRQNPSSFSTRGEV